MYFRGRICTRGCSEDVQITYTMVQLTGLGTMHDWTSHGTADFVCVLTSMVLADNNVT